MFTELVYDGNLGVWTYLPEELISFIKVKSRTTRNRRSGFYPYEYNFLFGRRDGLIQCSYCGIFLPPRQITRDHVFPKSRGGVFTTPACYSCNEKKANKLPIEWALLS